MSWIFGHFHAEDIVILKHFKKSHSGHCTAAGEESSFQRLLVDAPVICTGEMYLGLLLIPDG
jgi:hypothetical protein